MDPELRQIKPGCSVLLILADLKTGLYKNMHCDLICRGSEYLKISSVEKNVAAAMLFAVRDERVVVLINIPVRRNADPVCNHIGLAA